MRQSFHKSINNSDENSYLIKLFRHLADDLCILHVPEHLNPYSAWLRNRKDRFYLDMTQIHK